MYACANPLTHGILKKEWVFDVSVGPDFPDAQRDVIPSFLAGLDSGQLGPRPAGGRATDAASFANEKSLRQGVDDGTVPVSRIDDMIMRRLVPGFRVGVFDNPAKRKGDDISTQERRTAAVDIIAAGSVLLKNDRILPLGPNVKSIAIIGSRRQLRRRWWWSRVRLM